jgi:hypothetical protein
MMADLSVFDELSPLPRQQELFHHFVALVTKTAKNYSTAPIFVLDSPIDFISTK